MGGKGLQVEGKYPLLAREQKDTEGEGAAASTGEGAKESINVDDSDDSDDIQVIDGPSPKKGARARKTYRKRGKR